MRLRFAIPLAAIGGFLLDVASPGIAFWPASIVGAACIFAALWQQRVRLGLLLGAIAGAAFWGPHIFWLTLYLGPVPWLGLVGFATFYFALFGAAIGFVTGALPELFPREVARPGHRLLLVLAQSLSAAGLWVLREQILGAWPYGGFAWGRLAHMQAEGPLAQAVSWTGFAGLSGLIALAAALPVAALSRPPRRLWPVVGPILGSLVILALLAAAPIAPQNEVGTLQVGAVQGNSKSGIFDDRDSGDVLQDHVEATEEMLDRLEGVGESVDIIVWPENSAEFDLPTNALAKQQLAKLSERAGVPIVVGTVIAEDGEYTNSSLVWGAQGAEAGRYDKRYPVPFAEYMPNRSFYRMFAPDLVDLVQLEYSPGQLSPVIEIDTPAGAISAGIAICFDIIFDRQAVAMIDDGAEIIFAQTNNADFGRTDESAQQLAIARLRAIETGRTLVNISTVGTSAIVGPDGRDIAGLPTHVAASMVADVPLFTGKTPALRFGTATASFWVLCAFAGTGIAAASALTRLRGARQPATENPDAREEF